MSKTIFHIGCNDTVAEIKNRFSQVRPNFEINFFTSSEDLKPNNSCVMCSTEVRVRDINNQCQDGNIVLNDQMKMEEIESLIHDRFMLSTHVRSIKPDGHIHFATPLRSKLILFKDVPFGC